MYKHLHHQDREARAEPMSMKTVMGATDVRNNLGKLLHEVYRGEKHVVVEKGGIPVAALISMQEYEQFRQWLSVKLLTEMGRSMETLAKQQGVTEEQLMEELAADRKAVDQQLAASAR